MGSSRRTHHSSHHNPWPQDLGSHQRGHHGHRIRKNDPPPTPASTDYNEESKVSIMVKLEIMVILCMAILIVNFIVYPSLRLGGIRLHPDLIIPMLPIKKLI